MTAASEHQSVAEENMEELSSHPHAPSAVETDFIMTDDEVEALLRAEDRERPRAGAVLLPGPVVEDEIEETQVGSHGNGKDEGDVSPCRRCRD